MYTLPLDKNQADMERQEELIDQWTVLQWERSAVLTPRPGNGMPGAPTKWDNDPGVEEKVPTLFLDLNGLFTCRDIASMTGSCSPLILR